MSLEFLASYTFNVSPGYSLATLIVIQFVLNETNRSMSIIEFGLQIGYLRIGDLQAEWYQEAESVTPKWFTDNLDDY